MKFHEARYFFGFFFLAAVLGLILSLIFYFLASAFPVALNITGLAVLGFLLARIIRGNWYKKPAPFLLRMVFSIPNWLYYLLTILGFLIVIPNALKANALIWYAFALLHAALLAGLILKKILLKKEKKQENGTNR